jgi:hypothetical protein
MLSLTVSVEPGSHAVDAIVEAIRLAQRLKCVVEFLLNDTPVTVTRWDTVAQAYQRYCQTWGGWTPEEEAALQRRLAVLARPAPRPQPPAHGEAR